MLTLADHITTKMAWGFWQKVRLSEDGCWEWEGRKDGNGYGRASGFGQNALAHRVSVLLSGRWLPADLDVCHHCDNPACVRPSHLFLGTAKDNMIDRDIKGRTALGGANHGTAKLTPQQAVEARGLYLSGRIGGYKQVGKRFGVDAKTIWQIVKGKAWNHAT